MRRFLVAVLGLAAFCGHTVAQQNSTRLTGPYLPLGYCQLTASGTAALLSTCSGGIPVTATIAEICVSTANIRYRDDGTAPTATVGIPVVAPTCFQYAGVFSALSIIAQSGSPVIDVSFYK
jgi:hypothetical protein